MLIPLVLVLASPATASPLTAPTTITIRHSATTVHGDLFSSRASCEVGQTITVIFDGEVAGRTATDSSGSWRYPIPDGAVTARARFDGAVIGTHPDTRVCAASVSRLDKLRASPATTPPEPPHAAGGSNVSGGLAATGGVDGWMILRFLAVYAGAALAVVFAFALVGWRRQTAGSR